MDRINDPTAPNRQFQDGDQNTGIGGTIVRAVYMEDLQEELCQWIETTGQTPTPGLQVQVRMAAQQTGRRPLVFSESTTWVCPPGVYFVWVRVWGAGGGGGGSYNVGSGASGGSGAGYAEGLVPVTPGNSYPITVGAPGAHGGNGSSPTNGGPGGTSSFATLISATGGGGGLAANAAFPIGAGAPGTGVGGAWNAPGQTGGLAFSYNNSDVAGGIGGGTYGTTNTPIAVAGGALGGLPGAAPGGGRGGGMLGGIGGAGAAGLVILEYCSMWALIVAGVVCELTSVNPAGRYHPSMVWVPCLSSTTVGQIYANGVFSAPPAPVPTLAELLATLAATRYARQTGGVYFQAAAAATPSLVASDAASQGMITSSYVAAIGGHWTDGTPWKMADGSFVALTSADMQAMALKVLAYVAGCYAHEAQLAAALAANPATDITQGWPANT